MWAKPSSARIRVAFRSAIGVGHVHILATPEFEHSISQVFQSLGRRYVQYFNFTCHRTGTLWEGRYRATVVDSEQYLLTLMRYIELDPVRVGMVERPGDYVWSSHRRNAQGESGKNSHWIRPHDEYLRLGHDAGERQGAYLELFHAAISSNDLREIRECTHKGWTLGQRTVPRAGRGIRAAVSNVEGSRQAEKR